MNKGKRLVLFMACLIFGIGLFMIYTMMMTIDRDDKSKISHLSKSPKNATMKAPAEEQKTLLREQNSNDLIVASRGTRNRDTDYRANQIEKVSMTPASEPVALAAPTEVAKSAAPVAPAKTTATRSETARTAPAPAQKAAPAPAPKAAPTTETVNEVDLLARLITAEAQAEPYEAKVAVGAVVLNRVQSGVWANTIKEVIYQKINGYYQFTPVQNGWINKPAEAESIKAAQAALSGTDPTNGAQFYYDDTVKNTWILAKPVSVQYGHMIFAF